MQALLRTDLLRRR